MSVASRARCELTHTSDVGLAILRDRNAYAGKRTSRSLARRSPQPRKNKLIWVLPPAVFLFTAEVTFIAGCLHARAFDTPVITGPTHQATLREARLGLRVDVQPGGLRISWTPEISVVQAATGAILRIDEPLQHRELQLDPAQIAVGSILYRPASDDVTFRLELRVPGSSPVSQTVRVVGGSRPPAEIDTEAKPPSRKRNLVKAPPKHSWHWLEPGTTIARQARAAPIAPLQRPPDIGVQTVQNAGSLPFGPVDPPPAYLAPERRSKFLTTTIKHFGSLLKEPRKKGTSEAFMPSR